MASFDRRKFLTGTMATAAAAATMGLGLEVFGDQAGALSNGPGRNGVSHATPKKGGHLIFGVDAEEQGFNPSTARFDEVGVMYARTVFDPLTTVTPTGKVVPYLAQSVTPNADYTQWVVTLRPNIVFHDGTPCDGAALLQNFVAQYNSLLVGPVLQPIVEKPLSKGIVQSGPLSVTINLVSPWIPFPYYLAGQIGGQIGYVAAPSMLNAANGGTTHPVGTGPFIFKSWEPNDHFTAVRNPHYWRKGLPHLGSIEFRPIPDDTARSEALSSGTIDMLITDTPQSVVKYRGNRQWSYIDDSQVTVGEPDMDCILLNLAKPPFDNPTVRLAMAKSQSAVQYSKVIDLGIDAPSNGLFVPGSPYYTRTSYPKYDPAAATQLVRQMQHATGQPISFNLGTTPTPSSIRAATYVQNKLEAVGFKVSIKTFQQNTLIDNALTGDFQAYLWRQFSAINPDMNYIFWSTTTLSTTSLSINMARNNDPKVEEALQIGRSNPSPAARVAAYQTVNQRFAVDLPYLWQDRAVWAAAAKPTVQNFANPTAPSGVRAMPFFGGSLWPTQIWKS